MSRSHPWPGLKYALLLALAALCLASNSLAAESFRFAWLSDTHVGSATGEEDLRASVNDINSITGLSFVILSGDVTEYGSGEYLRLAKEILDGIRIPVHVIPGNHDTKWSESGATDFGKLWGADRFD
jgi:predicted phosphodiesterase